MTPDYNLIYENYKSSNNRTIHPFIKELHEQHLLQSIRKIGSNQVFATIALTWNHYSPLYKLITFDNNKKIAHVSQKSKTNVNANYMVYGHLLINNDSLVIEDSSINTALYTNETLYIKQPIIIYPNHKITLYNLYPTRNSINKNIIFHFNHLIFTFGAIYDVLRIIKKDPNMYVDTYNENDTINNTMFFPTFGVTGVNATSHYHIELTLSSYLHSSATKILHV